MSIWSERKVHNDGPMVRGVPEIGDVLRVADGSGILVGDDAVLDDAVQQRFRAIDIVDAGATACGGIEVVGMSLVHKVEVGGGRMDVVVHQQTGIILRIMIDPVVHPRTGVEIAHHHPVLVFGTRNRADGMRADVLHLLSAVSVSLAGGLAAFPVFLWNAEAVGQRPGVQRYHIEGLAADLQTGPAGAVRDQRIGVAGDARHLLNGVARSDYLRIIVPPAAQEDIFVTVALRQFGPMFRQVAFLLGHHVIGCVFEDGGSLAPYADVGPLRLHPSQESVIIVSLAIPHPVLDVPVQQPEVGGPSHLGKKREANGQRGKEREDSFHGRNVFPKLRKNGQ